ncbi:TPA: transporter [Vibrio parahaemolyticus]|nr:transporter [Vibrio parahaemolyticus]EIA1769033.1 transporter [Vibrio parahaemolyticus]EJG0961495.1 transporter [Vibrio parahaemolyticus]EJV0278794.1 transporter [Vibrio parahaemolyticus]HBC3831119.1 transporter [Vibrio parahaemolyticus]
MKRQRGALSAELSITLVTAIFLLVTLTPPLSRAAANYRTSLDVQAKVDTIVFESRLYYAKQVLETRCLAQTELEMSVLALSDEESGVHYDVAYQQSTQVNTRPSGIDVTVTINETKLLGIATWLSPDELRDNELIFHYPLNYQLPDYQELDIDSGCIR